MDLTNSTQGKQRWRNEGTEPDLSEVEGNRGKPKHSKKVSLAKIKCIYLLCLLLATTGEEGKGVQHSIYILLYFQH